MHLKTKEELQAHRAQRKWDAKIEAVTRKILSAIGAVVGSLIWICFVTGFIFTATYCVSRPCENYKIVESVGGCDLFGLCGVTFSDGTAGQITRPSMRVFSCSEKFSYLEWMKGNRPKLPNVEGLSPVQARDAITAAQSRESAAR